MELHERMWNEPIKVPEGQQLFPVREQGSETWAEAVGVTASEAAKAYAKSLEHSGALGLPVVVEVGLGIEGIRRYRVDHVSFYRAQELQNG